VREGDPIVFDVDAHRLDVEVDAAELDRPSRAGRRAAEVHDRRVREVRGARLDGEPRRGDPARRD
jgi:dihydroxyacid dehydratase/phosphogluconate dehydratase